MLCLEFRIQKSFTTQSKTYSVHDSSRGSSPNCMWAQKQAHLRQVFMVKLHNISTERWLPLHLRAHSLGTATATPYSRMAPETTQLTSDYKSLKLFQRVSTVFLHVPHQKCPSFGIYSDLFGVRVCLFCALPPSPFFFKETNLGKILISIKFGGIQMFN